MCGRIRRFPPQRLPAKHLPALIVGPCSVVLPRMNSANLASSNDSSMENPLAKLGAYLAGRHEPLLQAWQELVSADTALTSPDDLSRTEFRDHIPGVLAEFVRILRRESGPSSNDGQVTRSENSVEHGEHRWNQGYDLREVILEWGHLQRGLLDELEAARHALPDLPPGTFDVAADMILALVNGAIADSAEQFALLQQKQAAAERSDLESTVARFVTNEQRRVALWQQSSHDLRGRLSLIASATSLLEESDLDDVTRTETLSTLRRSTGSLKTMLSGVLEDVRAEECREERQIDTMDAGTLLGGLCAASQPLARERRLTLRSRGPESLPVEGDRGKIQRIVQNLLLNALAYTGRGEVMLSWREDDAQWWSVQVRDSGPGLPDDARLRVQAGQGSGAGIGLSIVRRLCGLLGAKLSVEPAPGEGTIFHVALPRSYAA